MIANYQLFTVCPNDTRYISQLSLLNFSCWKLINAIPHVLIPDYSTLNSKMIENKLMKVNIGLLNEDIYFDKFSLAYFTSVSEDFRFLFLDPDHLILKKINLDELANNILWVSSETTKFSDVLNREELGFLLERYSQLSSDDYFFNTSLICCNVHYFQSFIPLWKQIYDSLYANIGKRHLEEISFSIAALIYHYRIVPVPAEIQSNFSNIHRDSQSFHYGGESDSSKFIKDFVFNSFDNWNIKYKYILDYLCL